MVIAQLLKTILLKSGLRVCYWLMCILSKLKELSIDLSLVSCDSFYSCYIGPSSVLNGLIQSENHPSCWRTVIWETIQSFIEGLFTAHYITIPCKTSGNQNVNNTTPLRKFWQSRENPQSSVLVQKQTCVQDSRGGHVGGNYACGEVKFSQTNEQVSSDLRDE